MSGTPGLENLGNNGDDLTALARLESQDVDENRAAAIRTACLARLRPSGARGAHGGIRWSRPTWRALEPMLASGLGALYLLAVLHHALLLLRG